MRQDRERSASGKGSREDDQCAQSGTDAVGRNVSGAGDQRGGGHTDFTIGANVTGVTISPNSGTTPATVQVRIDPNAFQNQNGTVTVPLTIVSSSAVNTPPAVRLLINTRNPDQRGTLVDVPGNNVDLLADPVRSRFYILQQDRNQVLVFDGATYQQITALRTATTPTQMAFTFDRKYLLIGHDNSQLAFVYDLDSFQQQMPITFPAPSSSPA